MDELFWIWSHGAYAQIKCKHDLAGNFCTTQSWLPHTFSRHRFSAWVLNVSLHPGK